MRIGSSYRYTPGRESGPKKATRHRKRGTGSKQVDDQIRANRSISAGKPAPIRGRRVREEGELVHIKDAREQESMQGFLPSKGKGFLTL